MLLKVNDVANNVQYVVAEDDISNVKKKFRSNSGGIDYFNISISLKSKADPIDLTLREIELAELNW